MANWVARGLFDDSLPFLDQHPELADKIRFSIDAQFNMVDLEDADIMTLRSSVALVERVIAANRARGRTNFHDPSYFPAYMAELEALRELAAGALETARRQPR